jgi:hypothetical protein
VALHQSRQQHHWPVVYDQYWQNLKEHDGIEPIIGVSLPVSSEFDAL